MGKLAYNSKTSVPLFCLTVKEVASKKRWEGFNARSGLIYAGFQPNIKKIGGTLKEFSQLI